MDKLKKLITQLPEKDYKGIEGSLVSNKSEKFLFLLKAMRSNGLTDEQLAAHLRCNDNALHVLKSRLYDKIQKHLVDGAPAMAAPLSGGRLETARLLYDQPRETALAILHELEKKHLQNDVPGELTDIYSALKKAHYNSDKYYVYSQLYNKQVAYAVALEKAEDLLFNFNKTLSHYHFSRAETDLDLLKIYKSEINNIYALNQSHRIELIRNCITIQMRLYTPLEPGEDLEDLLVQSEQLIAGFPGDKQLVYYARVLNFFRFEYYVQLGQDKKAQRFFELTEELGDSWLLLSPLCQAYQFLFSRIGYEARTEQRTTQAIYVMVDQHDFYTEVALRMCEALAHFAAGQVKEASLLLKDLINEASFKDFFHIETEIKLTLAFFYVLQANYELAESLLKSVSRKLADRQEKYRHVKAFARFVILLMDRKNKIVTPVKLKEALIQFNRYNTGPLRMLDFLQPGLDKRYL